MSKKMDELALEIVELQEQLEKAKKNNKVANLKCNMNKIKAVLKLGFAISAVPAIGTGITLAHGWNPYKLNEEEILKKLKAKILLFESLPLDKEYQRTFDEQLSNEKLNQEEPKKLMKSLQ